MAVFEPRYTEPESNNKYYFGSGNIYENNGVGMPNCTAYAYGRFWEIRGGDPPSLPQANAEDWWDRNTTYDYGYTPKKGAVMCWRKGNTGNEKDGFGHVAIVEDVDENGNVVYSESWHDPPLFFGVDETTKSSGYDFVGGSEGYVFQGFIYCGIEFDDDPSSGSNTASNETISHQILNPTSRKMTTTIDEKLIWQFLILKIQNPYGVAGLMGNLYHESALSSINLEGRAESELNLTDLEYTQAVDNGDYDSESFITDRAGYGLAQWTDESRKRKLYNYIVSRSASIGNVITQLEYLYNELQSSYPTVLNTLKKATSVREASDEVMLDFEIPADVSEQKRQERASTGSYYYEKYSSITATSLGSVGSSGSTDSQVEQNISDELQFYFDVLVIGNIEG